MRQQLAWVPDVARGEWLRPMEEQPLGSILTLVPPGFEMYARIFHPVERDRPRKTDTWIGVDQERAFDGVDDIDAALETQRVTWADTAASFGTIMHRTAQYPRLVRSDYEESDGVVAPDGWRYSGPSEGCLDAETLTTVAAVLARHTTTPHSGVAAIWEGWGGLTSSDGLGYFSVSALDQRPWAACAQRMLGSARGAIQGMLSRFPRRPAEPGTGLLSAEMASGPRLELHGDTGRTYILFEAGAEDFAEEHWTERAPWIGGSMWSQSPSIIWPDDHSWVLATELDYDSTLIAGSTVLVQHLVRTPGLEVHALHHDADLSWEGDSVNHR
ncbi:hypothetical protein FEF26_08365 [Nesterenkonia salmonea]|uniref:DUF2716 domain-containing protein n=1 Tax=Nesterenkonia salmonea TaxID=1804987 RepID=A0A5R9BCB9_9MICC|nr:hypothetical protein [Nesterenkonia salmonea]TLP96986.1 hypothetical protein FEF26_08365 [Nesterenkonia salmonea]